uniref:Retrotransposon protein, putative, Ty1-copia subclass n=1 Tax=Tanacetum cinerariifolium TaxID=118510 RepID=A0A699GLS3_TANCI|nr:retrotransposon protein, putative, Ty1-copia subclass [Tanacetum cinerariifolium]
MHNIGKTIGELHAMLIGYEKGLPKKSETPQVMAIRGGKIQKTNKKSLKAKGKGKSNDKKRNCPVYLAELLKKKKQVGTASSSGKMTRKPFQHRTEGATDLLGIIHTDVYGPLRHVSRQGYPKEMMGYYFYFPPENKIVVARYVEFFEKSLITQKVSGRAINLKEIQDEDTSPSEITSEISMEVKGFKPPHEEVIPICRSERIHQAPNHLCQNVEVGEHSLGDLNEPTIYKAAMLDPESNKWLNAMNTEMQYIIDNKVWVLVDLPPNCKTVRSKWIFQKKTDMDGIVHTYKAHLVAKGYTQLYEVDYEETFSPVADIRAIRIFISIAAFYDYEIWKMDVKNSFLNGYLYEEIYMVQPEGFVDPKHPRKNSGEPHRTAMKNILKYLRNTNDIFLVYGGNPEAKLRVDCYCDARFETDRYDIKLGIVPTINELIKMFCDNSAALLIANEPGVQKGTRHYHKRNHYVRGCIELGEINLLKVHTDDNLADPFMKALPKGKLT